MRMSVALLAAVIAVPAFAHGPTPRKTDESVLIEAAPEDVWKKIVDRPCAIADWHPEITACDELEPRKLSLTLANGGKIIHEIDEIADDKRVLSYRLGGDVDISAMPVSSLNGKIKVEQEGDGARVNWMARYYRAFTGNEPPEGQDDETAKRAVDAFAKAGLGGLQETMRGGASGDK